MSDEAAVIATNGGIDAEVSSAIAPTTAAASTTKVPESSVEDDAAAVAAAVSAALTNPAADPTPVTTGHEESDSSTAAPQSLDDKVQHLTSKLGSMKDDSEAMHKATLEQMSALTTLVSGLQTELKASQQQHAAQQAQVRSANANPPFKVVTIGAGAGREGRLGMFINEEILLKKYSCCYVDYLSEENSVSDLGVRQGNYFVHYDTWDHMTESELCELVKNRPFTVGVLPSRAAMMEFIKAKKGAEFSATKRTFAEMNSDYGMPDAEKKRRLGGVEAAGLMGNNHNSSLSFFRTATAYPPGIKIVTIPSGEVLKDAATLVEHKHKSHRFCFVRRVKPDHQIMFGLIRSDNVFFCADTGRLLTLQEMYELMESAGPFRVGVLPSRNVAEILLLNSITYH